MKKHLIKTVSGVMTAALLFAVVFGFADIKPSYAAVSFTDTADHWAVGDINAAVRLGYINGYENGTFKPENSISRAEFIKIINSAIGYTELTNLTFRDVPSTEWYYPEVQKAVRAGYINGYGDTFSPDSHVTREEVATMLYRINPGNVNYSLADVKDAGMISEWALESVKSVYAQGYMGGFPDGNFNPTSPMKRGEAVKAVNKVLNIAPEESVAALSVATEIRNIEINSATLRATSTQSGSIFWVLVESSNPSTPSAQNVYDGKDANGGTPFDKGSISAAANTAQSVELDNLLADTDYKIFVMATDAKWNRSSVTSKSFRTESSSASGGSWITTYSVSDIKNSSVVLNVRSNTKGRFYWVAVEGSSSGTPSQDYIRSGLDRNGDTAAANGDQSISANSSSTVSITGLKSETSYRVYGCVYESTDRYSNYSVVKSDSFKTTSSGTEWITSIRTDSVQETSVDFTARFDVSGSSYKFYYVILESSQQTPSATWIISPSTGTIKGGNETIPSSKSLSYSVSGLSTGKTYRVHGVVQYGSQNSAVYTSSNFTPSESISYASNLTGMKIEDQDGKSISGYTFSAAKYTYDVTAPGKTTELKITPSAPTNTVVKSDGKTVEKGDSVKVTLLPGKNTPVEIAVFESGKTERVYTLNITVATPRITSLSIAEDQSFEFKSETFTYTVQAGVNKDINVIFTVDDDIAVTAKVDNNIVSVGKTLDNPPKKKVLVELSNAQTDLYLTVDYTGASNPKEYHFIISSSL
ncbi:MAG: S-layer homology domain-containing protein [Clostridiales Family XIII bacterium]|jgi:hypothetical protein|nr:S-layer homology domain-containing protein [Clostridiales Family XIII bacterium]